MSSQFKKGVLELVVMVIVDKDDIYGYDLVKKVSEVVDVNEGTIYPLLKRLTNEKIFETYLKESSEGPFRKYYRITKSGIIAMNEIKIQWLEFSNSINTFLAREGKNNE